MIPSFEFSKKNSDSSRGWKWIRFLGESTFRLDAFSFPTTRFKSRFRLTRDRFEVDLLNDPPLIQPDDNIRNNIIRSFLPLFSNIRKKEREKERDVLLYSATGIIAWVQGRLIDLLQRISSTLSTGCRFRSCLPERDSNSWRVDKWLFCF